MTHLVVLDCEAIQALRDPGHPKHRRVVSHAQVVASRKRRAVAIQMVVPTAVRVEAGWDRTGVSVADSHLGAVIQSATYSQITIVTCCRTGMLTSVRRHPTSSRESICRSRHQSTAPGVSRQFVDPEAVTVAAYRPFTATWHSS